MDYYSQVEDKGGAGRPVTTLPVLLFNEYKKYMIEKKNADPEVTKKVKTYQRQFVCLTRLRLASFLIVSLSSCLSL